MILLSKSQDVVGIQNKILQQLMNQNNKTTSIKVESSTITQDDLDQKLDLTILNNIALIQQILIMLQKIK